MKKTTYLILIMVFFAVVCSGCGIRKESASISLENYQVKSYSEESGHPMLMLMKNEESDETVSLNMEGKKELAQALYRYSGMIEVNCICSSDGQLLDYTVQDLITGQQYGKLDAESLYNTLDPNRFETVEKDCQPEILLSELEEDITYEYQHVNMSEMKIINDTGRNVVVYYDDLPDHYSARYRLYGTCISNTNDSITVGSGMIRIHPAETIDMIQSYNGEEDRIICLSQYSAGDSFFVKFQEAVYNDSEHEVSLKRPDGTEISVPKDSLLRLDWNTGDDWRTWNSDFVVK